MWCGARPRAIRASGSCPKPTAVSAAARNAGLEVATAPLVSFLDGDDRWHPQLLHRLLTTLETAPPHTAPRVRALARVMLASAGAVVAALATLRDLRHRPAPRGELPAARRQLVS
jgi:glycosyltransferase involved in cell wall biosynthesis